MDLFVNLEVAKKLKSLGFDLPVFARYFKNQFRLNFLCNQYNHNGGVIDKRYISAPLFHQVIEWIKEKYGVKIDIHEVDLNSAILTELNKVK